MRSQTYGDKQREAQQRKKQEELAKKLNKEGTPAAESPAKSEIPAPAQPKAKKNKTPSRRSA